MTGALGFRSAENCGDSAVAARRIFGPGRRHPCRGAETDSHGAVQETMEILQLQHTDKVIDVPGVPVQFPSAGVEKTAELPHCCRRALDKVVDMPVCATTSARGAVQQGCGRPCDHAGGSAPRFSSSQIWWTFQLAPETGLDEGWWAWEGLFRRY